MFKNVDVNTATSNIIVAAVAGKSVRLLGYQLVAAGDVTVTIEDSDGTNLVGPMSLSANGGIATTPLPDETVNDRYYAYTAVGKGLNILLSGAVQVGGGLQYGIR